MSPPSLCACIPRRALAMLAAIGVSAVCLALLYRFGQLDTTVLVAAVARDWPLLICVAACQAVVVVLTVFRYRALLRQLGVRMSFQRLLGPILVAQAVGTWMPASMAVSEAVRLGLMLGVTRATGRADAVALRACVTVASLVDRVVGLAAMLVVGGALGLCLVLSNSALIRLPGMTLMLALFSLAVGAALLLLPVVGRSVWLKVLLGRLARSGPASWRSVLLRVEKLTGALSEAFGQLSAAPMWFALPGLLSALVLFVSSLALYLPGLMTALPPAYLAIVVGVPLLSLSQVLPLGFAGLGSQQVITVGTLSVFALDASSLATASLLQNAVALVSSTLLGGAAAAFLVRDIAALRRTGEA